LLHHGGAYSKRLGVYSKRLGVLRDFQLHGARADHVDLSERRRRRCRIANPIALLRATQNPMGGADRLVLRHVLADVAAICMVFNRTTKAMHGACFPALGWGGTSSGSMYL
jgi:hypothetical protein